jgi:capsular polysaccharide transport system permease protein
MDDEDDETSGLPPRRIARGPGIGLLDRIRQTVPTVFRPPPPVDMPEQVQLLYARRAGRLRRFLIRNGIFVVLPSLLMLFYTLFIATPRYVCTFQETYLVYQPTSTLASTPVQAVASSADAVDYGSVIVEYLQSPALAEQLEQQLQLKEYYSRTTIDWTSRLWRHATNAQYLAYFNSHVTASEGFGGYITVTVQGFDPQFTLKLAQTINQDASDMLDSMSDQARNAEVRNATSQLQTAQNTLNQANQTLTEFRNAHGDLDPSFIATQIGTIEGTLESQLATLRAQLSQAQANLRPDAPQIVQLKLQVAAMEDQIKSERERLADSQGSSYSNTVAAYQTLLSDQQLATATFEAAQQGLVLAEADMAAKQSYVVDFVKPVLPDKPTVPNPWTSTALTFLACILGYGILNLLLTALRDQSGL